MEKKLTEIHKWLYAKNVQRFVFAIMCFLIFIYGFMYRIIDLRCLFWYSLPFILYYMSEDRKKNSFDISFLMLFIATLIIANIAYMREPGLAMEWSDIRLVFVIPTLYLLGYVAIGNDKKRANNKIFFVLTSLNIGMWGQVVLDYINRHFEPRDDASWFSFWKDDYEVRTVFDIGFLLMVSSFFYGVKNRKKNKLFFWISLIGTCISLLMTLRAGGRTISCVFVSILFICTLFDMVQERRNYSQKAKKIIFISALSIIGIIGVTVLFFINDIMGIRTLYENSYWSRQGGVFHNVRFNWAMQSIKYSISNPEGGWALAENRGGTHNTWLEFARNYNTFVFVIIVCYLLVTLINMFVIMKKETDPIKYYMLGSLLSMFIYLTMEPVGAIPAYYYIVFFIFISGIVNRKKNFIL